jgi:hypothetical protein
MKRIFSPDIGATIRRCPTGIPHRGQQDMVWWQQWLLHALPETLALLLVLTPGHSLFLALPSAMLLRLAWVAAELIHGAGHTLMRALLDGDPGTLCVDNLLEHRGPGQIARSLLPLGAIGPAGAGPLPPAWMPAGDPRPWKVASRPREESCFISP